MKRFNLLFMLLFAAMAVSAQQTFTISALVLNNNYQVPAANYPVIVIDSASGANPVISVYSYTTNANGTFSDTVVAGGISGTFWFLAPDSCGFAVMGVSYSTNSPSTLATAGIILCNKIIGPGPNICNFVVNAALSGAGYVFNSSYNGTPNSVYTWSFGDGTSAVGQTVTHTYAQPGTYVYCLAVDSCVVCDTVIIGGPSGCDASFTWNSTGTTVQLYPNAAGSSGMIHVDWGDGTNSSQSASVLTPISHIYGVPFTYTVCVIHVDSTCVDTICAPVTVPSVNCDASFSVSSMGLYTWVGLACIGSPGTLTINWGDGTVFTTASSNLPFVPYNHTYATAGSYTICVEHFDSTNCYDQVCLPQTVTASPLQCNASFIIDTVNSQPGTVYAWNMSSVTGGSPNAQVYFTWDFGDGSNTSSSQYPTHAYKNPGTYALCLQVVAYDSTSLGGVSCASSYCDTLTVDQNGNIIYKGAIIGWNLVVLNPASIGIDEDALASAKIYPNPARDVLNVDLPEGLGSTEVHVFNTSGTLVNKATLIAGKNTIDVANLPSGMYILQLSSDVATKQVKFIKN